MNPADKTGKMRVKTRKARAMLRMPLPFHVNIPPQDRRLFPSFPILV